MQSTACVALLAVCAAVSACNSPVCRRYLTADGQVDQTAVNALVRDLSASERRSSRASDTLVSLGKYAMPYLLREVDMRKCEEISEERLNRATRALRVIRTMGRTNAIEVCGWLLLKADVDSEGMSLNALFTEAVVYLGDNFHLKDARDSYVTFVTKHRDKYLDRTYLKTHWRAGRRVDLLRVDITSSIPLLLHMNEKGAADIVTELVRIMRLPTYGGIAIHRLAQNGFTIESDERVFLRLEQLLFRILESDRRAFLRLEQLLLRILEEKAPKEPEVEP